MNARIERPSGWAQKNNAYGWRVVVRGSEPQIVPDVRTAEDILDLADEDLMEPTR